MRRILSVLYIMLLPVLLFSQKEYRVQGSTSTSSPVVATTLPAFNAEIIIPVVVHIITSGNAEPITMDQVNSQIDALNRDFNAKNEDRLKTPSYFSDRIANCGIRFVLARVDPAGQSSTGVVYKQTKRSLFGLDEDVKFSAKGGDDAWPRNHYFNIWVCPMISSIHGYTSNFDGPAELDGIVLNQLVFGTINKLPEYNMGRIAVHETGHWLGLKHIWGDGYCGDDGIDDTPQQKSYNKGCPSGIINSCGSEATGDMYMNFMDLTNDDCMFMFTEGQKKKMREIFEGGNLRHALLGSGALGEPGNVIDMNWGKQKPESIAVKHIALWPVPSKSTIRVDLADFDGIAGKQLVIYNMAGQALMNATVSGKQVTIDISALNSGQYLVKVAQSTIPPAKFVKL